jgi:hypothetical protein
MSQRLDVDVEPIQAVAKDRDAHRPARNPTESHATAAPGQSCRARQSPDQADGEGYGDHDAGLIRDGSALPPPGSPCAGGDERRYSGANAGSIRNRRSLRPAHVVDRPIRDRFENVRSSGGASSPPNKRNSYGDAPRAPVATGAKGAVRSGRAAARCDEAIIPRPTTVRSSRARPRRAGVDEGETALCCDRDRRSERRRQHPPIALRGSRATMSAQSGSNGIVATSFVTWCHARVARRRNVVRRDEHVSSEASSTGTAPTRLSPRRPPGPTRR